MKPNQLVGQVFNRLTVIADAGRNTKQNVMWLCRCECGGTAIAPAYDLRAGKVKSCGCLVREGNNITHGHGRKGKKRNPAYSIWAAMIQRCTNPNDQNWHNYGGRGITVCDSWKTFEGFYADMGDKPDGKSLDRINNSLGYNKENCAWVLPAEQTRNKRNNVWITIGDTTQILTDWATQIGFTREALYYRVKKKNESPTQAVQHFINIRGM